MAQPSLHHSETPAARAPEDFKTELLGLIPFLRAFARSLCGHAEMADDLAQEALVKAWQSRASFIPGTNLKAWLFTILRNQFYSDRRRAWRQAPWDQDAAERIPGSSTDQIWSSELSDTARALRTLTDEQREALILVGAGGFSYEEAAAICRCAVGTVKSRVARARKALIAILEGEEALPSAMRPDQGDAARDIMAQLDRIAPEQKGNASGEHADQDTNEFGQPVRHDKRSSS
jgi:RNA polymerase sigma-70 factor (ECF subfamily)